MSTFLGICTSCISSYFLGLTLLLIFEQQLNLFLMCFSQKMQMLGMTVRIKKQLTVMTILAKIPKEQIGMIGLIQVERKLTAVVIEVTSMALDAFLKVQASLKGILFLMILICLVCDHMSWNTNTSSAPIPIMIITTKRWSGQKQSIFNPLLKMTSEIGMLIII